MSLMTPGRADMHVTVPVHEATLTVSSLFFFQRMNVKVNGRAVLSTLSDYRMSVFSFVRLI